MFEIFHIAQSLIANITAIIVKSISADFITNII